MVSRLQLVANLFGRSQCLITNTPSRRTKFRKSLETSRFLPSNIVAPLLRELILLLAAKSKTAEHVLTYLSRAEFKEYRAVYCDDIRIAWLTVLFAGRGYNHPWETAFHNYLGKWPHELIPFFVARAEVHKTELFPDSMRPLRYTKDWQYDFQKGMEIARLAALPPKKPAQSVGQKARKKVA